MATKLRHVVICCLLLWVASCASLPQAGSGAAQPAATAMVSGRVTPAPGPAAALQSLRVAIIPPGYPALVLEAAVAPDGSFRIAGVPRGPYIARVLAGRYAQIYDDAVFPARALFVGDGDVTNLELEGPVAVRGRIVIEGGRLPVADDFHFGHIEIQRVMTTAAGSLHFPDGSVQPMRSSGFLVPVLPSEYQLTLSGLPMRFALRSMTSGSTDLLRNPLVVTGAPAPDIVLTLTQSQSPGFSIRGRVTDPPGTIPQGVEVRTLGARTLEGVRVEKRNALASVNPDGTFELQGLAPGTYDVELTRMGSTILSHHEPWIQLARASVTVRDQDVSVELAWRPLSPVSVRVVQLDADGVVIPGVPLGSGITGFHGEPPAVTFTLTNQDGTPIAVGCDFRSCPAAILRLPMRADDTASDSPYPTFLPPGTSKVGVERLPAGTVVRSIRSGTVDLLQQPLVVGRESAPVEVNVVVQYTGAGAVTVSGRVVTSASAPLLPPRVTLRSSAGRSGGAGPYRGDVSRNGEFAIRGIPPGTYELLAIPDGGFNPFGSATTNIEVTNRDVTNVPLVGLSAEQVPTTLQAANEAAAVTNLIAVSRAEREYHSVNGRYGTLADLIAAALLSPGHAGTNTGYRLTVDATATLFSAAALPVTSKSGRYELYWGNGSAGIQYLRTTDVPPSNGSRTLAGGPLVMQPLGNCGSEDPFCIRPDPLFATTLLAASGRVKIAAAAGAPSLPPSTIYVGLVSSGVGGNFTSVRADGSFRFAMPPDPGGYTVAVENLPPGFRVSSVSAGGIELENGAIRIADGRLPTPIDVTIDYR